MSNSIQGLGKFLIGGGVVAVAALVSIAVFDYPPATDDAAGTIVPAKRFRADGGGTTIIGDSAATQSGIVTDRASTDAANAAMADGIAKAQMADGVAKAQMADGVAKAQMADGVAKAQMADGVAKAQMADGVAKAQMAEGLSRAQMAEGVAKSQAADASTRAQ